MGTSPSLGVFDVTASALTAERARLSTVAENIANAQVTRTANGGPYRRKRVTFETVLAGASGKTKDGLPPGGVRMHVEEDTAEPRRVRDPSHPDADKEGFVAYPNVSVVDEMVDLLDSARTYEANLSALKTYRQMLEQTLQMAR